MDNNEKLNDKSNHNVIMENRKRIMITGVRSVENFDDTAVCLQTCMGQLTIKGSELKVDKLNVGSGELNVQGNVIGMVYSDSTAKGGIISRLFK